MTEEEFCLVVTDIKNEGILNETEHDLIQNTIKYDETLVAAIMRNVDQITGITVNEKLTAIKHCLSSPIFLEYLCLTKKKIIFSVFCIE